MSHIRRIFISRLGHKSAEYSGVFLPFHDLATGRAGHTMYIAENGTGKTTALSLALSVFDPAKSRFVQALQRRDHRYEDYFWEQPGIVAVELQESGPTIDPWLRVVGYVQTVDRVRARLNPQFFSFRVSRERGLEYLPWPGTPSPDGPLVETWKDVLAWKARWGSGSDFGMTCIDRQDQWVEHLNTILPVSLIASQVDLARTEGGLSKLFETLRSDDDVISTLSDMTGLSDLANSKLDELRGVLKDIASAELLEREIALAEGYAAAIVSVDEAEAEAGQEEQVLQEAKERLREIAGRIKRGQELHMRQEASAAAEAVRADVGAVEARKGAAVARLRAEGWRVLGAKARLAVAQAASDARKTEERRADDLLLGCRLSEAVRDVEAARARRAAKEAAVSALQSSQGDLVGPAKRAGSALKAALSGEKRCAQETADVAEEDRKAAEGTIRQAEQRRDAAMENLSAARADLERLQLRKHALRQAVDDARAAGVDPDALEQESAAAAAAEAAGSDEVRRLEVEAASAAADEARHREAAARAEAKADELREELSRRQARLAARLAAIEGFRRSADTVAALGDEETDVDDPLTPVRITEAVREARSAAERITASLTSTRAVADALRKGFARPDADLDRAASLIRELGVEVRNASDYVSRTVADGGQARLIVESDPARMFHGLVVNSAADLQKVREAFDARGWQLAAPVLVSVISHDVAPPLQYDHALLSAWTEAAYHLGSREAHIRDLEGDVARLEHEASRHGVRVRHAEAALEAFRNLAASEKAEPLEALRADCVRIESEIGREASLASASREQAASEAGRIRRCEEALPAARAALDGSRSRTAAVAAHRTRIEGARREAGNEGVEGRLQDGVREAEECLARSGEHLGLCREQAREASERRAEARMRVQDLGREADRIHYAEGGEPAAAAGQDLSALRLEYAARAAAADEGLEGMRPLQAAFAEAAEAYEAKSRALEERGTRFLKDLPSNRVDLVERMAAEIAAMPENVAAAREHALQVEADAARKARENADFAVRDAEREARFSDVTDSGEAVDEDGLLAALMSEWIGPAEGFDARSATCLAEHAELDSLARELARQAAEWGAKGKEAGLRAKAFRQMLKAMGPEAEAAPAAEGDELEAAEVLEAAADDAKARSAAARERHRGARQHVADGMKELAAAARVAMAEKVSPAAVSLSERLFEKATAERWVAEPADLERLGNLIAAKRHKAATKGKATEGLMTGLESLLVSALGTVKRALKASIPSKAGRFGGLSILKCSVPIGEIEAAGHRSVVLPFFERLKAEHSADADGMKLDGRTLITRLLKSCLVVTGREAWDFSILSPVAQSRSNEWQKLHRIKGSGGQVLTSAFLLYLVIAQLRNPESGGVFLLLDNPLGTASAKDLVQTQIAVADAMGIQIIAFTGIKEYEAMRTFGNIVQARIYKGRTRSQVAVEQVGKEVWTAHYSVASAAEGI